MISTLSFFPLYIEMFFDELKLASGTGFLMNSASGSPYLITNRHNLTGRDNETQECLNKDLATPNRIEITHYKDSYVLNEWVKALDYFGEQQPIDDNILDNLRERVTRSEPLYDSHGQPLWFEHTALMNTADFVALKLTNIDGAHLISFTRNLSQSLKIGVTEKISVIGYPFGKANNNFPVWANGTIASDPILNYNDLPITLIDCRSRGGQSGSPVFLFQGSGFASFENGSISNVFQPMFRFLGIYSGRIHKDSDIGYVWRESAIYELIDTLP